MCCRTFRTAGNAICILLQLCERTYVGVAGAKLAGLAGLVGPQAAKRGKYNVLEYRKSLALQSYRADASYLFLARVPI